MRHAHSYQTIPSPAEDKSVAALNRAIDRADTLPKLVSLATDVLGDIALMGELIALLERDTDEHLRRVDAWYDEGMRP